MFRVRKSPGAVVTAAIKPGGECEYIRMPEYDSSGPHYERKRAIRSRHRRGLVLSVRRRSRPDVRMHYRIYENVSDLIPG